MTRFQVVLAYLLMLMLPLSALLARRLTTRAAFRNILIWLAIIAVLALIYNLLHNLGWVGA